MAYETAHITLAILLLTSVSRSLYAITVVNGPTDTQIYEGGTVELFCRIADKGSYMVYWLRENKYLTVDYEFFPEAANPRYTIFHNGKENVDFVLRITNVQLTDSGRYRCGHFQPTRNFRSATLTVRTGTPLPASQKPPIGKPLTARIDPPHVTISEVGQRALFTCEANGTSEITNYTFFFDNVAVKMRADADRFIISRDSRELEITNLIASDDNVPVRCDVSIPSGLSASSSGLLRVFLIGQPNVSTIATTTTNTTGETSFIGALSRRDFFLIIIIIGTVVGQGILVVLVLLLHRCLKTRRSDSKKMMTMEWKGVTSSTRVAHELVPGLTNMTAPRRYTPLDKDNVDHPRYTDLEMKSSKPSLKSDEMDTGVYEGVATNLIQAPRVPNESSAAKPRTPQRSSNPPTYPPPRASSIHGSPRMPPNDSDGVYRRPTSNALSSMYGDRDSYQGYVIKHEAESASYEEPPVEYTEPEYIEPIADDPTVYEVSSDGYVNPYPKSIEDPDIDDYEVPPTESYVPV